MTNDDVVKCPLCGGFSHIENPDLLAALKNPQIREQVEHNLADLLKSPRGRIEFGRRDPSGTKFPERRSALESLCAYVAEKPEGVGCGFERVRPQPRR